MGDFKNESEFQATNTNCLTLPQTPPKTKKKKKKKKKKTV